MTLGCWLTVSQLPLKQWYAGSNPATRAFQTSPFQIQTSKHRGGNCWSLHLALNQANTGSIPVLGAVARSGAGFQRLTVNEFVAGSIPVGHPEPIRW